MSFIHEGMAFLQPYLESYGLFAIFGIIYLETLGAPLPGESALIAASALAVKGDFHIVPLMLMAWAAGALGGLTGYALGRAGGRPLLLRVGRLVKLTPERLDAVEDRFHRHGAWIVIAARFIVILRQLNGLVAGSLRMPFPKFLVANLIGAGLWSGVWTFGPYLLADVLKL